ncbi:ankyrin repeat-containing domain [Cordyceps militaris CM01]|uniref:Ankyrin repeat-containing domain n=1 Tax=Cordyceps militaris (strain CM01) TaxID=983644 RepID=G3JMX2_CORMM|nr:ankyrin repeat-containing domain [Cordyceps militaris CM01]EGX90154.1 ankyrin repeat-containing domain [Cordyceps militaris CM01]
MSFSSNKDNNKMELLQFPKEIILLIADFCELRELNRLAQSCQSLQWLNNELYRRDARQGAFALFWASSKSSREGPTIYDSTARHVINAAIDIHATGISSIAAIATLVNMRGYYPVTVHYPRVAPQSRRKRCYGSFIATTTPPRRSITPLGLSALTDDTRMAQLLVKYGADVNLPCNDQNGGDTPIELAIWSLSHNMVNYLVDKGVNIQVTTDTGRGAIGMIGLAVERGNMEILKSLLTATNDPDEKGFASRSALYIAVLDGCEESVKLILTHPGVDPNYIGPGQHGNAALHAACEFRWPRCVEHLCKDNRVDCNALNERQKSAVDLAMEVRDWEIVSHLVNYGHLHRHPEADRIEAILRSRQSPASYRNYSN